MPSITNGSYLTLNLRVPEILKDPTALEVMMRDPNQQNPDLWARGIPLWHSLSLSNGLPGALLLFSNLEKLKLLELEDEDITHRYVLKIKETIEKEGLGDDLSLFSGLTGICFALQSAGRDGKRYQRFLSTLQTLLLNKINSAYLEPIRENIRSSKTSSSALCDVIQGLSGIGRYALENIFDPRFEELSIKIIETLIAYTQPLIIGEHQIPGWYLSATDVLNTYKRFPPINGSFNLGLAHGIPGVLSFLSIALLKGVVVEGQKESISTIARWVKKKSFLQDNNIQWASDISWEEEIFGQNSSYQKGCRDAWCYGSPGVSRSLFLAACATSDQEMKTFASQAFREIFKRSLEDWFLPGPGICHGIAGLLLITDQMTQEEGFEDLSQEVEKLASHLTSHYDADSPFGFKDIETRLNGDIIKLNKPGLLEGAAGIFLTLATLKKPSKQWHMPFLIHV